MRPSEFFKSLDLSKLDSMTQIYIREKVFGFPNIDLLEGTKEFEILQKKIENDFPLALGIQPKVDIAPPVKKKEPIKTEPIKIESKKVKTKVSAAEKQQKINDANEKITEIKDMIDLLTMTLTDKPKDVESKDMLELMHMTLPDLELQLAEIKKMADGGVLYGKYVYKFSDNEGNISACVEDLSTDEIVFEFKYPDYSMSEEERLMASTLVDDGFMKSWDDVKGLEVYLKDLSVIPTDAELVSEQEVSKFNNGGEIPNNYEGKKPEEIWSAWDLDQRTHFLQDHANEIPELRIGDNWTKNILSLSNSDYSELPTTVKDEISIHIETGQYAKGGSIKNQYEGKSSEQVWNDWTKQQREHFLSDHDKSLNTDDLSSISNLVFKDLPSDIETKLWNHVNVGQYSNGGGIRTNKSALLKYVNFEDNWHINLLELNPNRNNSGLKYKTKYKYAVVRSSVEKGQEVFEFKTIEEAEKEFDKLVTKGKTYAKIINEGETANYGKYSGVIGWGNDGSTPSNNEDYNNLYALFPNNHAEAKSIWNQLSEKQKEGFLNDLRVTDAASEHIAESWLEFVNAKSENDWLENATNWDEMKNGGGVGTKITATYIGEDDWSRRLYKGSNGKIYADVDGVLHTITNEGEPNYPVSNIEKIDPINELSDAEKFENMMKDRDEQTADYNRRMKLQYPNLDWKEKGGGVGEEKNEKVYADMLRQAKEDKEWAEMTKHDKKWMKNASEVSKKMLNDFLDKSVEELADESYKYFKMRSYAVSSSGNPIDPSAKQKWEDLSGETIKYEHGGSLSGNRGFTKNDYDRLIQSDDKFEAIKSGKVLEIYHDDSPKKILGKFNSDKNTLSISGKKDLSNQLVKWLQQNSYVSSDEYEKLQNGGGISKSKKTKGEAVKSKKEWFKEAVEAHEPDTLGGWSKDIKETTKRRRLALSSRDKNSTMKERYLSVARALQALSNVTKDTQTKKIASNDAKYFLKKYETKNK